MNTFPKRKPESVCDSNGLDNGTSAYLDLISMSVLQRTNGSLGP